MLVYLANKEKFRDGIRPNLIEKVVHERFQAQLNNSRITRGLPAWKHSLRGKDAVLEDAGDFGDGALPSGSGT